MQAQLRRLLLVSCSAALVLTLVACGGHVTAGTPVQAQKNAGSHTAPGAGAPATAPAARPPAPPKPVPTSELSNLFLSTDDINDILGLTLDDRAEFGQPSLSTNDVSNPNCALTMGITREALGNGEFTAFGEVQNKAMKDGSLVGLFRQHIAIFETPAKASDLFHAAYKSLGQCNSSTISVKDDPSHTNWKVLAPGTFNGDVVTFGILQLDDKNQPMGWRCDREVRVKNNVILEVSSCAWANGGMATAAAVDQISARIPPPDKPAPPTPANFLAQNKIRSVIVGAQQVSKILGVPLGFTSFLPYPPDPRDLGDKSNCSVLEGPDAKSLGINIDYIAYRQANYQEDKDNYQHAIFQQATIYPDEQTASGFFQNAFKGLNGCDNALLPTGVPNVQFQMQPPTVTGNTAQWASIELTNGQPDTWRCAYNYRAQSNVFFGARMCQFGDPTQLVSQIVDQMADALPK
jgi:hypothetical protein